MTVQIKSFSYRDNQPPQDCRIIDCRTLPNPHYRSDLQPLTGRDEPVQTFLRDYQATGYILDEALEYAKTGYDIAFGCYGGRHRSVAMAEMLGQWLAKAGIDHSIEHVNL